MFDTCLPVCFEIRWNVFRSLNICISVVLHNTYMYPLHKDLIYSVLYNAKNNTSSRFTSVHLISNNHLISVYTGRSHKLPVNGLSFFTWKYCIMQCSIWKWPCQACELYTNPFSCIEVPLTIGPHVDALVTVCIVVNLIYTVCSSLTKHEWVLWINCHYILQSNKIIILNKIL